MNRYWRLYCVHVVTALYAVYYFGTMLLTGKSEYAYHCMEVYAEALLKEEKLDNT